MMSGSVFPQELEQDPFDSEDFVERLAWRLSAGDVPEPTHLHKFFEQEIQNLQALSDQCQTKINRLQNQCQQEEEEFYVTLERLQAENQSAVVELKQLEDKINSVSTKVVHLGSQLENADAPRTKASEALQLMKHFNEFLSAPEGLTHLASEVFTDPEMLVERAGVISKLYMVAQELPSEKFATVRELISKHYDLTEQELIDELLKMQRLNNMERMKKLFAVLSQFKNYQRGVDNFIEWCQIGAFRSVDIFSDISILCERSQAQIEEVFAEPSKVMASLMLNVFEMKLKEHVRSKLDGRLDTEQYLQQLADLYSKTQKLVTLLSKFAPEKDKDFLALLTHSVFAKYLDSYQVMELKHLRDHATDILQKFYESKNHQKKTLQAGAIQDFKRDITTFFLVENFGGETFLSEEVAISILQDTKLALERCHLFGGVSGWTSSGFGACEYAEQILDILIQHLCQDHIHYAIELALYGIPLSEPKTAPGLQFLMVLRQVNAICHLFEKQFTDSLLPIVMKSAQQESVTGKKNVALKSIEAKLSNGMDRLINAVTGHCRYLLANEQRKTDYKPEMEDNIVTLATTACTCVTTYLKSVCETFNDSLDGDNLIVCVSELAIRFHRVIVDQIYQFQYNTAGALILLCDVSEYKKFADDHFKNIPLARKLFETLRRLCNLLAIAPETLVTLDASEYEEVDRSIISSFIQLRADYKTTRLVNDFRT